MTQSQLEKYLWCAAKVATLEQIAENDFNLNIPLYVEKVIEDNLPSELAEESFLKKLKQFIVE